MDTEQRILCLGARTRLDDDAEARLLQALRGPVDWARLWKQGQIHEVLPLLGLNLRKLGRQIAIPDLWLERFQQRYYATLLENTLLADELLAILSALREKGVDAIPVKGVVLAETLYGDLGLRQAADIDVLVRECDLPAARLALAAIGFARKPDADFGHLHHPLHDPPYLRQVAGRQMCVELHWTLWASHLYGIRLDQLWDRTETIQLRGNRMRNLSPEDTLLYLVIHRARTSLRLRLLCDIAELLRRHGETLDWDYVLRQARSARARTALYWSLGAAHRLLDAPAPAAVLRGIGPSRIKQRLLTAFCGDATLFGPPLPDHRPRDPSFAQRWLMFDDVPQATRAAGYRVVKAGKNAIYLLKNRSAATISRP